MSASYDKDLPLAPTGFTKRCEFHLSYEAEKKCCGKAIYRVVDADGVATPVFHRYDTHPSKGYSEYAVEGCDDVFKRWADAAAKWNTMRHAPAAQGGREP